MTTLRHSNLSVKKLRGKKVMVLEWRTANVVYYDDPLESAHQQCSKGDALGSKLNRTKSTH